MMVSIISIIIAVSNMIMYKLFRLMNPAHVLEIS